MTLGQTLLNSYRELRQNLARRAEETFGRAAPAARSDAARGEFISDFITERGLSFPSAGRQTAQR